LPPPVIVTGPSQQLSKMRASPFGVIRQWSYVAPLALMRPTVGVVSRGAPAGPERPMDGL
jgi:hypothetical protein